MNWQAGFNKHWTERRPNPLTMTDTEIIDWIDEYSDKLDFRSIWRLHCFGTQVIEGKTVREVVTLAAAHYAEENE